MKSIALISLSFLVACATKAPAPMDVNPRDPASSSSVPHIRVTSLSGKVMPDLNSYDRDHYWAPNDNQSPTDATDSSPSPYGGHVRKLSLALMKELCPGDSTLGFNFQEYGKNWTVKVIFDRNTHAPAQATLGYTFDPSKMSPEILNFGYSSFPDSLPTVPTVPFNASVTFDPNGGGVWETITINTGKPQTVSRNDLHRSMSQGASLVLQFIVRSNLSLYASLCKERGLL